MALHFSSIDWLLAVIGAICIGLSKSGFSGISLVTIIIMARLFPPRESTGVVLPLLLFGDCCAVIAFRQHANWKQVRRMLPPTLAGVIIGYFTMQHIPGSRFGPVIGSIVLSMVLLQAFRQLKPALWEGVPHSRTAAWAMGAGSGVTTMLANAAGPIMSLYFLAINLPKYELIGTSAWFFLIVNLYKVPFSLMLGLIRGNSLALNVTLAPAVALGAFFGRRLIAIIPQRLFEMFLLVFAGLAALHLIGVI